MTTNEIELKKTETAEPQKIDREQAYPLRTPKTDIYETHDSFVIIAEVPGVETQNMDITLTNNILTLDARVTASHTDEQDPVYQEYIAGDFRRVFTLGDDINRDKIHASLKNGLVRITLPKAAETQPKKINIETT